MSSQDPLFPSSHKSSIYFVEKRRTIAYLQEHYHRQKNKVILPVTMVDTQDTILDEKIPEEFLCCLTLDVMINPVMDRFGNCYERQAIMSWMQEGSDSCPLTRRPLKPSYLVTNSNLKKKINLWRKEQGQDSLAHTRPSEDDVVVGFVNVSDCPSPTNTAANNNNEETTATLSEEDLVCSMLYERLTDDQKEIVLSLSRVRFPERTTRRRWGKLFRKN